ncbi:MAG: carboxypeptidase-like regulatory domain-containing protein, partial [Bacteroidetes bacterium]|nr:carboxypeptidase-like regulatory domain-containing protein [Bacteroidota bacterium]
MKFFILYLSFLVMNVSAQTGSIKGHLTSDGDAVEYAAAGIPGTSFSTVSDKKGKFEILNIPYGKYDLVISIIGYK